jgi:hypothetical protein
MAVKYADIKAKIETNNFTPEELQAINHVEKFIDDRINKDFDNSPLYFDLGIINFERVPDRGGNADFKKTRRKLMRAEIDRRFTEAGWKITVDNEDLHWQITGK